MECPQARPVGPARSRRSVVQPRWTAGALARSLGGTCGHRVTHVRHQRGASGVSAAQSIKGVREVLSVLVRRFVPRHRSLLTEGEKRRGPSILTPTACAD